MKKMKSALALCLALLLTAGCGGKTVEQVDAGNYVVEMPGDVAKESQSIPIEISEIGLSSSMTLTTTETVDYSAGATYTAVEADWGQLVQDYKTCWENAGHTYDQDKLFSALLKDMMSTLLAGAIYDPGVNDTIQDRACVRYSFTLPPDEDEEDPLPSKTRRGQYVVFVNESAAYVLVYVAEEDGYNEHTMEDFFQSIRFK
ncbi:MAG: hypothetical protein ACLUR9_05705 [Christensenellales bacterium]|jgi:uncharacterized cupredoxin-like copper-binding protein